MYSRPLIDIRFMSDVVAYIATMNKLGMYFDEFSQNISSVLFHALITSGKIIPTDILYEV